MKLTDNTTDSVQVLGYSSPLVANKIDWNLDKIYIIIEQKIKIYKYLWRGVPKIITKKYLLRKATYSNIEK